MTGKSGLPYLLARKNGETRGLRRGLGRVRSPRSRLGSAGSRGTRGRLLSPAKRERGWPERALCLRRGLQEVAVRGGCLRRGSGRGPGHETASWGGGLERGRSVAEGRRIRLLHWQASDTFKGLEARGAKPTLEAGLRVCISDFFSPLFLFFSPLFF